MPRTVNGLLSWVPLRVSFAGVLGLGFCVGFTDGDGVETVGVGVADGVCAGALVVGAALTGRGEATGLAVQPVNASTAASASALLRQVTAGRAS
jgi:hypothetical protein